MIPQNDYVASPHVMKTKLLPLSLIAIAILWPLSVALACHLAYDRGYQQGGRDERSCWTIDPAPTEAWLHGVITARRDTTKHPFFKPGRVVLKPVTQVNSIPATRSP